MKIVIGSDHAGYDLKEAIKKINFRELLGCEVDFIDVGTYSAIGCDYPIIATSVVKLLKRFMPWRRCGRQKNFGILICFTGFGMAMVANRYRRIRAVECRNEADAAMARERNNANILCLGSSFADINIAIRTISTFVSTKYYNNQRYNRRLKEF